MVVIGKFFPFTFAFVFSLLVAHFSPVMAGGSDISDSPGHKERIEQGQKLFSHYCSHCHGSSGDGEGSNAEYLDKEPADLTDLSFIGKKTNEHLFKVISLGGRGVKRSTLMPGFGKTLSEYEIGSLVTYIRFLAEDKEHPVKSDNDFDSTRPQAKLIDQEQINRFSEWFVKKQNDKKVTDKGKLVFLRRASCIACHQMDDEGGHVGPDLTRAGVLYSPQWLYTWVNDPQRFKAHTPMPRIDLADEEIRSLVVFLSASVGDEANEETDDSLKVYLEEGGDAKAGANLFFDENSNAYCSKCHKVADEGGSVGPELSIVGTSRTPVFLLESILHPKAVITTGYSTVLALMKDGKFITGVKKSEDDIFLEIINKEGDVLRLDKQKIKKYKTQKISTMPGNFGEILSKKEIRDLLAYLRTLKTDS